MKISDLYIFLSGVIISYLLWQYPSTSDVPFLYLFIAIIIIISLLYLLIIARNNIKDLKSTHKTEVSNLKSTHKTEVEFLKSNYENTISNLKANNQTQVEFLKSSFSARINKLKINYEEQIEALKSSKLENAVFIAKIIEANNDLILFKPNIHNIINYDQLITVYVLDSNFERFYAIAKVTNIQSDRRFIQAQIVLVDPIALEKYGDINEINSNLLKISPNVSIEKIRSFDHLQNTEDHFTEN